MIIDCDTHLMPRDAFVGVDGRLEKIKPQLKFDDQGRYVDVDFPGYPDEIPGTSPLLAPGSGAMFKSLWDPQARTWQCTWLNMTGSFLFGLSAIGAYVIPETGDLLSVFWANAGTLFGAACFLVAALLSRPSNV